VLGCALAAQARKEGALRTFRRQNGLLGCRLRRGLRGLLWKRLVAANVLEIRFGARLAVEHMRLTAPLGWVFLKVLQKGRRRRRRRGRRNCARGMAVLTKPTRETARQSSCQNAVVGRRPRHQGASTRLGGKHGGVGVDAIVRVDVCVTKVDGFAGGCT